MNAGFGPMYERRLWAHVTFRVYLVFALSLPVVAGVALRHASSQRPAVYVVLGVQRGDFEVLAPVPPGSEDARCREPDIDGRPSE